LELAQTGATERDPAIIWWDRVGPLSVMTPSNIMPAILA
jgi:hypothetical protein